MRCRHGIHGCLLSESLTGHRYLSFSCGLLGIFFQLPVLGLFQRCAVLERRDLCLEISNSRRVRCCELRLRQCMLPWDPFVCHLAALYLRYTGCCCRHLRGSFATDGRSALHMYLWLVRGRRFRWL